MATTYPKLVVIVGETASGKSDLAMHIAQQFGGEIICADSWTVYKGFDIGTAKPTLLDRKTVPHHLLDVAEPLHGFSAAEFKRKADIAIKDISAKGKVPILVGGTGLYVDSILFDYGFLPAGSEKLRQELNKLSIEQLLARIKQQAIDIAGIDIRNKRRLVRLLETGGQRPSKQKLRPNTLLIGLSVPADDLQNRVTGRVDAMLANGLENEVADLAHRYGWAVEPMKGIGYREFKDYFNGVQTISQTRERIIQATLQFAKKQRTWFKRNKSIHWQGNPRQAMELVTTFLNT